MNVKPVVWVLGLLALAFPAAAHAVLTALAVVAVVLLAHPTPACAIAAGVLLASKVPALRRRTAVSAARLVGGGRYECRGA